MSSLIDRLRAEADADLFGETVCAEAADRIEELEEQLNASRRIAKAHANNFAKAEARLDAVAELPAKWREDQDNSLKHDAYTCAYELEQTLGGNDD